MTSHDELLRLYSHQILELAKSHDSDAITDVDRFTATRRAPLCGSEITVTLTSHQGRIEQFHHIASACALGKASAMILHQQAIGLNLLEVRQAQQALECLLAERETVLPKKFDLLKVLGPASQFPSRHASILLAWKACIECLEQSQQEQPS